MNIKIKEEAKLIRDPKTPDLFHALTEADIDVIVEKLLKEPKARFKDHINTSIIREVVVSIAAQNPKMVKKFIKYKKNT